MSESGRKPSSSGNGTQLGLPQRMVYNTSWSLMGQGGRLLMQLAYFTVVAHALGPREYGAFVSATALASVFAPFSGVGIGNILVKNVARDHRTLTSSYGNALVVMFCSAAVLTLAMVLTSHFALPPAVSVLVVSSVAVSDLLCQRLVELGGQAFQAVHQMHLSASIQLLSGVFRLIAAVTLILFVHPVTAARWSLFYIVSSVLSAAAACSFVQWKLTAPTVEWRAISGQLKEGFHFSTSLSAQSIYNDIDKTMLARLSTLDAAAIYAVAYRFVDAAMVPVRSVAYVTYPQFFKHGVNGIAQTCAFAKKVIPKAFLYGFTISCILFFFAPVIPYLFGHAYGSSAQAMRWLCWLPAIKSIHSFQTDVLTGAGYQFVRSAMQWLVAIFNVAINFWLIPIWGWKGAAWSSLAADGILVVLLQLAIWFYLSSEAKLPRLSPDPGI
jgi:O-antigen/teichoic acid export membrane protein